MLRQLICSAFSSRITQQSVPHRCIKRWVSPTLRELKKRREMLGPDPITNRKTFIEWNYNAELFAFGQRLSEQFDLNHLQQSFTHRSYIIQEELRQQEVGIANPDTNLQDNRPLIEKGEQLVASHINAFISAHLPRFPLAGIAAIQQYLMSDESLANISTHLGTSDLILSADFPVAQITLADTMKAIVGALNASAGHERTFEFVRDFVCSQLNQKDINDLWSPDQPLQLLHELCLDKKLGEPEPRLIGEAGKNTILAAYHVGIYCNRELLGTGFGENVDIAIEMAARNSLTKMYGTNNVRPFNYKISADECFKRISEQKKNVSQIA